MSEPLSLQIIGSKALGGAERWFVRFTRALAETGAPAELAIRAGSELADLDLGPLPLHHLPLRTVWDPWSRRAVSRLIARVQPDIVQTYMGRATRLTRLGPPPGGRSGALGTLGGAFGSTVGSHGVASGRMSGGISGEGFGGKSGRGPGRSPVHVARLGGYYALHPYRHAHAWIGNTRGLCDWLIQNGLPAARVHHIYNFVDPARPVQPERLAALRAELALPADAWMLVTAGRFVPVKGLDTLIAALARLPAAIGGRPVCLVLLGDGPLGPALRRQAEDLGVGERIRWAGWQQEPGPYFQLSDVVVFPSRDEETLGNVILEAWTWGKPLVTSRFRGAREIARHGEDVWCVPCDDDQALAAGIREVLADDTLRRDLARAGQTRVQAEFARGPIMARYLELYRQLASGGP
ncbi:MAG: glycosyltransferase [Chromatiaceae bacterium]|nr:glycosyltransferase [Candidatus Thioaporhodococcus sediminis]